MKMKDRNALLKATLGGLATPERLEEVANIPIEDTVNRCGNAAYTIEDELKLLGMLNTNKITSQAYRTEDEVVEELGKLVESVGMKDPYLLAQMIVYSRCMGEGLRSINHLAATIAAPFISGKPWAKAFYGAFNKKAKQGGTIFRLDDMREIKDAWAALNTDNTGHMTSLPNAMKKGFASVIENADGNLLAKYKDVVIDIANLSHPSVKKAKAEIEIDGKKMKVMDAIVKGHTIIADTHESANSEAGQLVAEAVKTGKLDKVEAEKVLADAKNANWKELLKENKLGVLAALRNIRNIMNVADDEVIDMWCKLIDNKENLRRSLILPINLDLPYTIMDYEFPHSPYKAKVQKALLSGYEKSLPNLATAMPGKTCIMIDCSGSMGWTECSIDGHHAKTFWNSNSLNYRATCSYKAGLIAATFAKATGADVIKFGTMAQKFAYDANKNVFDLAKDFGTSEYGGTSPETAYRLITNNHVKYDRIIFISDNENNGELASHAYKNYVSKVCSPYVYGIDLACYGTTPIKNDGKVSYYYGYGAEMYNDITKNEFNPMSHIDKVRKVVIDPNYNPNK